MGCQANTIGVRNPSEGVKKLVSIVLGPFRMALFPEPSLRAWTYFYREFDFFTPHLHGACDGFRERPIPSSRFRTVVFLTALGNRHGEFHQRFFVLAIADSRPANKGSTTELLWVNSPPPEPISVYDYHRGISAGRVAGK
jgi:hypothetical protein